jgi:thiazole synthase
VIGDEDTCCPTRSNSRRADTLVTEGFTVLPYTNTTRSSPGAWPTRLCRGDAAGCRSAAGRHRNPHNIAPIRESVTVPVVLDAGIGTASDAALAMAGCDAVLLATWSPGPGTRNGWHRHGTRWRPASASRAGRIPRRWHAEASTSMHGLPDL